jgi:deleted-in-malignant-brain-tumors protein 1
MAKILLFLYTGASSLDILSRFGQGSGPILLDEVGCRGSEERLLDCSHLSSHDCLHHEDVSVRCNTSMIVILNSSL